MEVKGVAFVGRKDFIINNFGESIWKDFFDALIKKEPYFGTSILSTTLIPVDKFIMLQEEIVKTFYKGDEKSYWIFGEKSAEFALLNGPYKIYITNKNVKNFVEEKMPTIWKAYYTDGYLESKFSDGIIDVFIRDIPVYHTYFEYTVMGFIKKSIELLDTKVTGTKKIKSDNKEIHYQFTIS